MKALTFIGLVFAGFLFYVGITSKGTSGAVLGNAVIVGGVIILLFLGGVWAAVYWKERQQ